ncbi:globin family protein [Pseudomonas fluorescens group sp. PF-1]
MTNPYQLLGGEAGVHALREAFYAIMNTQPEAADMSRRDIGNRDVRPTHSRQ